MKYDEDSYNDLQNSIRIDRDMLDVELVQQANLFFHASEGAAYAESIKDKKKATIDKVFAELDYDIRENMNSDGERITEEKVKQQINRELDYQNAVFDYNNSIHNYRKWETLKNAYRMRADMLKSLVTLNNSNYFGEVTGATERRDSVERLRRV